MGIWAAAVYQHDYVTYVLQHSAIGAHSSMRRAVVWAWVTHGIAVVCCSVRCGCMRVHTQTGQGVAWGPGGSSC